MHIVSISAPLLFQQAPRRVLRVETNRIPCRRPPWQLVACHGTVHGGWQLARPFPEQGPALLRKLTYKYITLETNINWQATSRVGQASTTTTSAFDAYPFPSRPQAIKLELLPASTVGPAEIKMAAVDDRMEVRESECYLQRSTTAVVLSAILAATVKRVRCDAAESPRSLYYVLSFFASWRRGWPHRHYPGIAAAPLSKASPPRFREVSRFALFFFFFSLFFH